MKRLALFFANVAAIGLVVSIAASIASYFGTDLPSNYYLYLHVGAMGMGVPTIYALGALSVGWRRDWKLVSRGASKPVKYTTVLSMIYGIVRAVLWNRNAPLDSSGPVSPTVMGMFSGMWTAVYAFEFLLLWSAAHAPEVDAKRRCLNGHHLGPLAKNCEICGEPLDET